jgi:transcriptional regulator with XRE-family HTH domain
MPSATSASSPPLLARQKRPPRSSTEARQIERFVAALQQAIAAGGFSQRELCERLDIRIGTLTKYLNGDVAPLRVGVAIQAALARVLGVTTDALLAYYCEGAYATDLDCTAVESWIRREASAEDLPVLMAALQEAGQRWLVRPSAPAAAPVPYLWPIEELRDAGISDKFRQRLGLTDEALKRLAHSGDFDEELAEAFSVACNYELPAVLEAFRNRAPVV